jgi:hypothetical protein
LAPLSTSLRVTARVERHPGDRRAKYVGVRQKPVPIDAPKVASCFDLVHFNQVRGTAYTVLTFETLILEGERDRCLSSPNGQFLCDRWLRRGHPHRIAVRCDNAVRTEAGPAARSQDRFRICHADYRSLRYRAAPISGSKGSMAVDHSGCRYFGPALGTSVKANRTGLARLT